MKAAVEVVSGGVGDGNDSDVVTAVAPSILKDFSIERNRVIVFVVRSSSPRGPGGHESVARVEVSRVRRETRRSRSIKTRSAAQRSAARTRLGCRLNAVGGEFVHNRTLLTRHVARTQLIPRLTQRTYSREHPAPEIA